MLNSIQTFLSVPQHRVLLASTVFVVAALGFVISQYSSAKPAKRLVEPKAAKRKSSKKSKKSRR